MEVSKCPECKKALRAALVKGLDPSKLKMKDGHLPGCPTLAPKPPKQEEKADDVYPWSEQVYKITPPQAVPQPRQGSTDGGGRLGDRPQHNDPAGGPSGRAQLPPSPPARRGQRSDRRAQHGGRARVHGNGYAEAEAQARPQRERIQQFKVVDHANKGERRSQLKGAWFPVLFVGLVLSSIFFPPLALAFAGAIAMLFLLR